MRKSILLSVLLLILAWTNGIAQPSSIPSSSILHEIEHLKFNGSVLYIAAHPDDENTRLISWLTKSLHADVSYLSLTRGDGGQNLIGKEIGPGLGLLRSCELLAAREIDGGRQFFTRAIDFGYSKTPAETYEIWNKEEVLYDMVKVIRSLRPDVIITRFSETENPERPTHGHYTASAQLAFEAMEAAADMNRFPDQLNELGVWQVKKLFWNTSWWFYGNQELMEEQVQKNPGKYIRIDVNPWMPLLGSYCSDIAAHSRSQHKSQGFGSSGVVGEQPEYLEFKRGDHKSGPIFSGITTSWTEIEGGKPIQAKIDQILDRFDPYEPVKSISSLLELSGLLERLPDDNKWKDPALERVEYLIRACAGIKARAYSNTQHVSAGEKIKVSFELSAAPGVSIEPRSMKPENLSASKDFKPEFKEGKWEQELELTIPDDMPKSQPFWLESEPGKGSYTIGANRAGMAMNPYPFHLVLKMAINGEEVEQRLPVRYHYTDPVKGSIEQPMIVRPDVMLNLSTRVLIFPDNAPRQLEVEVLAGKSGLKGFVELNMPEGWRCEPAFYACNPGIKGEVKRFTFKVYPSAEASEVKIRAIFKTEKVYSNSMERLKYDHIPELEWYPTSDVEAIRLDLKRSGQRIAYIPGAGDQVAEHLGLIGYDVAEIAPEQVTAEGLRSYDATIVGIRAFNTYENAAVLNEALNTYCKQGGTVIVQYNTSRGLKTEQIGPYKLVLSRDRVTEEQAAVEFLSSDHPALNFPNKLGKKDFDGWVQERGLYFPEDWDPAYTPLLSMHDQGEKPLKGSLLVAQYGEGYYVYTGLSFFRELPAGVSGAYRLFANLIALGDK